MKVIILTMNEFDRRRRLRLARAFFKKAIAGEVKSYSEIPPTTSKKRDNNVS